MSFASVATAMPSAGYLPFSSGPTTLLPGIVPLIHRLICPTRQVDRFILFANPKSVAKNHAQFSWVAVLLKFPCSEKSNKMVLYQSWHHKTKLIHNERCHGVATETAWNPPRLSGIDFHGNVKQQHYFEDEMKPLNHIMFPHWEG